MRNFLLSVCFAVVLAFSPSQSFGMDTCYKIEFEDSVFSFVAPETGVYTFKGGNVENSPNGYLITVHLNVGEIWVVPDVNGRDGAAISHVIICPTDPETPDCIYKDPALIRYGDTKDLFRMRGRLLPDFPMDFSSGMAVTLSESAVLTQFVFTPDEIQQSGNRIVGRTESSKFTVKPNQDGTFGLRIRYIGDIQSPPTGNIVLDVVIQDQWFQVYGAWKATRNGWLLSNKNYQCPEVL